MIKVTKATFQHMPVKFGRYGVGEESCSISAKINRETFEKAAGKDAANRFEHICCGTRCEAELKVDLGGQSDVPGQGTLIENDYITVTGVVAVPHGSIGRRTRSLTLQFDLSELSDENRADLERMACREGLLSLKRRAALEDRRRKSTRPDEDPGDVDDHPTLIEEDSK